MTFVSQSQLFVAVLPVCVSLSGAGAVLIALQIALPAYIEVALSHIHVCMFSSPTSASNTMKGTGVGVIIVLFVICAKECN